MAMDGQAVEGINLMACVARSRRYLLVARRYTQRYPAAPLDCTLDQHLTRAACNQMMCPLLGASGLLEAGLGGTIFLVSGTG